jgi:hypothetical protein
MPTRFVHLTVDSVSPQVISRFWSDLLDWPVTFEDETESYLEGGYVGLTFVPVPEPKSGKNRVHPDLASTSAAHQDELVTKALDLGARKIDIGQGDVPWIVLADPDGNEFCVLEPREIYADTGPLAAVVLDCADPAALALFWVEATGWPVEIAGEDSASLRSPSGAGPWLELLRGTGPKRGKNRVHLDVAPFPGEDHAEEVARLLNLGARAADVGQQDVPWAVLVDPEGNELCVLTPR